MDDVRQRILVVDPKATHRTLLVEKLSAEGFEVAAAEGVSEAIARMHHYPADLILAELAMPVFDGISLTQRLRITPPWTDVPVILISGRHESDGITRALAGGANDVIVKPFHFETLTARIARQLQLADLTRERGDRSTDEALDLAERAITFGLSARRADRTLLRQQA